MNAVIPFNTSEYVLNVLNIDGEPWFVAKEVADILGYSDAEAMTRRLDGDEKQNRQIVGFGPRGATTVNEAGLYSAIMGSTKPEAKAFKRWVTHEVLPSIRKTGGYGKPAVAPLDAWKLTPLVIRAARAHGLDKNAASISANQAVAKLTGVNVLELLGHTHLTAENQEALWFTPTELGKRINVSGRQFNLLLAEAGLQAKEGEHWKPLPTAEAFYRLFDTGKRHGSGTPVQQLKWADNVMALIKAPAQEAA